MAATFTFSTMAPGLGKRPARLPFGRRAVGFAIGAGAAVIAGTIAVAAVSGAQRSRAPVWSAAHPQAVISVAGVFTGEYQDGVPVYRLPPVTVVANRDSQQPLPREAAPWNAVAGAPRAPTGDR
jgi:hypothetical protein